jgi:hypothetical protein
MVESRNPYTELRERALNVAAEDLGLATLGETEAFGVVIDIAVEGGSATFTAFRSGDASMYTSGGGGIIGGVGHEEIRHAAGALVKMAGETIPDLTQTTDMPLPDPNRVRFYVLTTNGKFVAEETDENFFTATGPFADLFLAANNLLTELRQIDDDRQ